MRKVIFYFLLVFLSFLPLSASNESNDIETLLEDMSTIATKKNINVDYMPSVVTVIDAQTYIDAGVQNISQALGMLPGFQVQMSPMGYTITTVRGFKNPNAYFADKTKVLIDGVPINNDVTGTASFYLNFPMQLVDKIEVLRGPASTMYGGGAYYGAVNIITKLGSSQKNNQIYIGGGSYGAITAGTDLFTTQNGWNIFVDGYAYSNNKALSLPGYSPQTDEATKDYSVGFKASKGSWEFLTRLKHETSGNYYSFEGELNPLPDRPENHSNIYFLSQLSNKSSFGGYELETKINYSRREKSVNANIKSSGDTENAFSQVGVNMTEGFYSIENTQEDNYGFESTLSIPKFASNDILLGIGATYDVVTQDNFFSSVENAIVVNNITSSTPGYNDFSYRDAKEPAYWLAPTATSILPSGISRTNAYGYLQDLISIGESTDLVLGLRYDGYSDVGGELSKRAGLVYRASDTATFKLLYGSAYRASTLTEKYALGHINLRMGDPNLKTEECNTYEAAAVYAPDFYNKLKLNFYYTALHNVIDLEELVFTPYGYEKRPDRISKGVEFEYFFKTAMEHNFYLNLSYTKTDYITSLETHNGEQDNQLAPPDPSITEDMPDISPFMAKALYIYKPTNRLSFGSAWRYFSSTTATNIIWVKQWQGDTSVKAANIFDETVTYNISSTSTLRATVKNLFNEEVRQPAYYYYVSGGIQREGRNYLVSFVQRF